MNGNSSMTMMQTYFQATTQTTVLFQSWETKTFADYMLALFLVFAMSFSAIVLGFMTPRIVGKLGNPNQNKGLNKKQRIVFGLLSALRVVLTYLLMLVVMTFNAGLFVAVILGSGAAYYIFADIMWRDHLPDLHGH